MSSLSAVVTVLVIARGAAGDVTIPDLTGAATETVGYFPGLAVADAKTDAMRACGSDLTCMGAALGELGLNLGLEVSLSADTDPALASVVLFDRAGAEKGSELTRIEPRREVVLDAIRALTRGVLESTGRAIGGRLILDASPSSALGTIDGRPPGPDGWRLPPGRYDVEVTLEGHAPARVSAEVIPAKSVRIAVQLEPDPPVYARTWFWVVAVGTVVAAGATAIIFATRDTDRSGPLCQADRPDLCEP